MAQWTHVAALIRINQPKGAPGIVIDPATIPAGTEGPLTVKVIKGEGQCTVAVYGDLRDGPSRMEVAKFFFKTFDVFQIKHAVVQIDDGEGSVVFVKEMASEVWEGSSWFSNLDFF